MRLPSESFSAADGLTSWPVVPVCLSQGVLHTVAGYLLYTSLTFKCVFDYQPSDVYWCTADIGWITGHSYVTYGPLANGATSVLVSSYPSGIGVSNAGMQMFPPAVFKSHASVFFSSLKVSRSTLTSAASGRSLRSIKYPSSTRHLQPSGYLWSMGGNLCRSELPFPSLGAFAVLWNPDVQEATWSLTRRPQLDLIDVSISCQLFWKWEDKTSSSHILCHAVRKAGWRNHSVSIVMRHGCFVKMHFHALDAFKPLIWI